MNPIVSDTLIFRILKNKKKIKKEKEKKRKKERTICLTSNVLVIGNDTCTTWILDCETNYFYILIEYTFLIQQQNEDLFNVNIHVVQNY